MSGLYQTIIYLGAAIVAVPLAKRLGLGSVIGYLLAGTVIGPHALNLAGGSRRRDALRGVRRGHDALCGRTRTSARPLVADAPADSWTRRFASGGNGRDRWLDRILVWLVLEAVAGRGAHSRDVLHRHRLAIAGRTRAHENAGGRSFLRGPALSGHRYHPDHCPDAAAGRSAQTVAP